MIEKPFFSVIVPTYNGEKYISKTVSSILNQTYKNFELIVIDDGSTDNTVRKLKSFKDIRLKIYRIKNSGGPARPRNIGIKRSLGKFIAFCDDDDFWSENKLNDCKPFLKKIDFLHHECNLLYTHQSLFNKKISNSRQINFKSPFEDLLKNGNAIITSTVICRKNIFEKIGYFNESHEIMSFEDYEMWLRISKITNRFFLLKKSLGSYRVLPDSISRNGKQRIKCIDYIIDKYDLKNNEPLWMIYHKLVAANSENLKSSKRLSSELLIRREYLLYFSALIKKYFKNHI